MGFFDKLKEGLQKTKNAVFGQVNEVVKSFRKVDEDLLEELEEIMIICICLAYFFTYLPTLATFASSSAASISSKIQKGEGFTRIKANNSAIAMNACSPPESRFRFFMVFPGGAALISIPQVNGFSGSVSNTSA